MIETLLNQVKELVDLKEDDTTYDKKLTHAIKLALLEIKSYCNLVEVPQDLYPIVVEVVSNAHLNAVAPIVGEIEEGDTGYKLIVQEVRTNILNFKHVLDSYTIL